MQGMLTGQPGSTAPQHTDAIMPEQHVIMARATFRLPADVLDRLRRHYHEQRLAGGTDTLGDMVTEALRTYLDKT
jgi:hypothetical protein